MFKQRIGVGIALTLFVVCLMWSGVVWGQSGLNLLKDIEPEPATFKEFVIGEKIVYWQRRMVGPAIVEKDQIVYHFDKGSHELLDLLIVGGQTHLKLFLSFRLAGKRQSLWLRARWSLLNSISFRRNQTCTRLSQHQRIHAG